MLDFFKAKNLRPTKNAPLFGTMSSSSWSPLLYKTSLSHLSIIVSAQELIQACLLAVQQWKRSPIKQRQSTIHHISTISTGVDEKLKINIAIQYEPVHCSALDGHITL